MKIPLSWISLYSPLQGLLQKYAIKDLAHEYSIHTAEIDGIETHFLDKVVVGKVISCEKHPDSKKLSIVRVNLGEIGEETILTGAQNIGEATYVPVAIVGAILPGDFTIGERMMAGMMSRGMICGADEIGMSTEESTGIMVLEQDWDSAVLESQIGKSFFDLTLPFVGQDGSIYRFPLRDTTFEIDNKFITNRPDLFSIRGNAREFHAVFDIPSTLTLQPSKIPTLQHSNPPTSQPSNIPTLHTSIQTPHCLSYHLLKMDGITVGKSPFGMSLMMERAGLAPKMDIVDITNCLMTEFGQPMHVFDAAKIIGNIHVRQAKLGEKIVALNGSEYTLTSEDMVIADDSGPIALAGVIGGMASAVSQETTSIIWESACFDATSVRLTSQRHGIRTDASTRYEKSLDPTLAGTTFGRVKEYLEFLGKTYTIQGISEYIDASRVNHIELDVSYAFINMKAGIEIPPVEVDGILNRLGFIFTTHNSQLTISVPSWRASKDIHIQEDIAEEVIRVYGYDNIPFRPLGTDFSIANGNPEVSLRNMTLNHFSKNSWNEVYNYSFSSEILDKMVGYTSMEGAVQIQNAFNEEYTHMSRSLAPRLFLNASHNQKYGNTFQLFEVGKIYHTRGGRSENVEQFLSMIENKPFPEMKRVAGVSLGVTTQSLRTVLESYLKMVLGYIPPLHQGATDRTFLHPGISGKYTLGDTTVVRFGKIHPETASLFDISPDILYFECDYEVLLHLHADKDERFIEISRFQTIPRELNFILPKMTPTGHIGRIIDAVHPWIRELRVDSVYEDNIKIGEGMKSVNFAFTLSNTEGTITDDEALSVQNLIIDTMMSHGYKIRG